MAQTEATRKSKVFKLVLFMLHVALMEETISVVPMPWKQWWYALIWGQRSGGTDIRGFHNDTCTHLMGMGSRRRHERVLVVGRCPAVSVVADERVRVPRAGDPEVGLACTDEGGHARKRTCGNPENWCAVVPSPDCTDALLKQWKRRRRRRR